MTVKDILKTYHNVTEVVSIADFDYCEIYYNEFYKILSIKPELLEKEVEKFRFRFDQLQILLKEPKGTR